MKKRIKMLTAALCAVQTADKGAVFERKQPLNA